MRFFKRHFSPCSPSNRASSSTDPQGADASLSTSAAGAPDLALYFSHQRVRRLCFIFGTLLLLLLSAKLTGFTPARLAKAFPAMGDLLRRMYPPQFDQKSTFSALVETFYMAFWGTLLGFLLALPTVHLSCKSLVPAFLSRSINFLFAFFRTLPSLVHAALLVALFRVGTFAGLMALAIIAWIMTQKLLRERIEALPLEHIDSFCALGISKTRCYYTVLLSQVQNDLLSIFLLCLESNLRSASVLGLVGAGGIGQLLWRDLNHLRYARVLGIIILIFSSILILDALSALIRKTNFQGFKAKSPRQLFLKRKIYRLAALILFITLCFALYLNLNLNAERLAQGQKQALSLLLRLFHPDWSYLPSVGQGLWETFWIALTSTLIASIFALILSPLAASNLSRFKAFSITAKALINLFRSFPPMITAILCFRGLGPGAASGVFALSIYTLGVLCKMDYEALENAPENNLYASQALGIGKLKSYIFVLRPETFDRYIGLCLYRFESNLRNSTLLGIIGAGGIGQRITQTLQLRQFERAGLLILCLAAFVLVIDRLSAWLQKQLR